MGGQGGEGPRQKHREVRLSDGKNCGHCQLLVDTNGILQPIGIIGRVGDYRIAAEEVKPHAYFYCTTAISVFTYASSLNEGFNLSVFRGWE